MPGPGGPLLRRVAVDLRPLRHEHFRRLFVGQGVSLVGYQLTAVAVPVQMYDVTGSSAWVGAIGLAGLVPLVVFGLYGGSVSDAVDRRRLLLVSSLVLWVVTGGLLLQAVAGWRSPWVLLALVAFQSVGFAFSAPTRGAVVPRVLPAALVPAGNTLNFTVSTAGSAAGPLLAGLVIANGGLAWAYATDAVLFTAALHATLRLPPLPPLGEVVRPGLRSVAQGLAFIATRPVLLASFAIDLVAMVLAMPKALFPEVAARDFGGAGSAGLLFAAIPLGSAVAGVVSGWVGRVRRQGLGLVVAVVVWGAAVAAAGLAGPLWLVVLLLAVGGAADLVSAVYRQTILQTYAPDALRGRLQGVFVVVVAGGPRLGDVRAGATAAVVGATASWVGGGLACVVLALLLAALAPALVRYRGAGDELTGDDGTASPAP